MSNSSEVDKEKLAEFKTEVLELEKISISNINKTDDRQMIDKIIRSYEEGFVNNANK